jgi:hypothetical protein
LCTQYCQCLWVVPSGLPLRFSLTLILCMNKACEPENYSMYLLVQLRQLYFCHNEKFSFWLNMVQKEPTHVVSKFNFR